MVAEVSTAVVVVVAAVVMVRRSRHSTNMELWSIPIRSCPGQEGLPLTPGVRFLHHFLQ